MFKIYEVMDGVKFLIEELNVDSVKTACKTAKEKHPNKILVVQNENFSIEMGKDFNLKELFSDNPFRSIEMRCISKPESHIQAWMGKMPMDIESEVICAKTRKLEGNWTSKQPSLLDKIKDFIKFLIKFSHGFPKCHLCNEELIIVKTTFLGGTYYECINGKNEMHEKWYKLNKDLVENIKRQKREYSNFRKVTKKIKDEMKNGYNEIIRKQQ